ncbi:MAG: hypothetical protein ABIH25_01395 [Candidatus Woesearchaeota archaeon]
MKLNQNKVDELILNRIGEDVVDIVRFLIKKGENISEFIIAEKLDIPINQIRNMLYRLQQQNLVTFMRKKDKKKGWYIYYWTFNDSQAVLLEKSLKTEKIDSLKQRLGKEETEEFFVCPKKCIRLTLMRALEGNFKCPECDRILKQANNKKVIKEIRRELEELEGAQEAIAAA